jgi:hypothetical protein
MSSGGNGLQPKPVAVTPSLSSAKLPDARLAAMVCDIQGNRDSSSTKPAPYANHVRK